MLGAEEENASKSRPQLPGMVEAFIRLICTLIVSIYDRVPLDRYYSFEQELFSSFPYVFHTVAQATEFMRADGPHRPRTQQSTLCVSYQRLSHMCHTAVRSLPVLLSLVPAAAPRYQRY